MSAYCGTVQADQLQRASHSMGPDTLKSGDQTKSYCHFPGDMGWVLGLFGLFR